MRNAQGTIDWTATANRASEMTDTELWGAIADINRTLPHADALDRENNTDNGGYYRDEASVYHRELTFRHDVRKNMADHLPMPLS
tara:strand:- start:26 stop:280 length:255 start_codon:yes stop_codon:yes gene_type:complete